MSDERAIGQLEGRVAALEGRVEDVEQRIDKRLEAIEKSMATLSAAFNMGQGARWATARFGGLLLLAAGAVAWLWDHLSPYLMGKTPHG